MTALSKNNLIKGIILSFFLLPTMAVLISFQLKDKEQNGLEIGSGMPSGETALIRTDGDTLTLNNMKKENGLIVIFSCNTCPFVVGNDDFSGWEKDYNDLYTYASENSIGLVLINSNEAKREGVDSLEEMKKRSLEKGYKMDYLMDQNSVVADAFGARTTPHVFMFDTELNLIYKGSIDNSWDSKRKKTTPYLRDAIERISNGKSVKNETTQPKGCSIKRVK